MAKAIAFFANIFIVPVVFLVTVLACWNLIVPLIIASDKWFAGKDFLEVFTSCLIFPVVAAIYAARKIYRSVLQAMEGR